MTSDRKPPPTLRLEAQQPAPRAPEPAGERFSRVGEVGRGAMGIVEAVDDALLGRRVAVKRLRPELLDEAGRARFHREAALTARLEHPGIAAVHDAGVDPDGRPWYSMRLVEGRTLTEVLAARPDLATRLPLVRQVEAVAQAVGYAHAQGVVHRDLKPDNVIVGRFGEVTVIDWGVAQAIAPPPDEAGPIVGTFGFLCPEAARGLPCGPRGDVWSLGALLHTVLTGRPPQAAAGLEAALRAAARGEVNPLPAEAPGPLRSIVARALARDPAERYPDGAAFAADLAAWIDGRPVAAHRYTAAERLALWARRHRHAVAVASLAALAIGVLGFGIAYREAAHRGRARLAEQAVAAEEERARVARAAALTERARFHLERGEPAEAGLAAAEALVLAEAPELRGLLLASEALRDVSLEQRTTLPTACHDLAPAGERAWACVDASGLALWSDGSARWRGAPGARAVRPAGPGAVWVHEDYLWWRHELASGLRIARLPMDIAANAAVWPEGPTGSATVFAQLERVVHVDAGGEVSSLVACPPGEGVRALAAREDGGAAAWLCHPLGPLWAAALTPSPGPPRVVLPRAEDDGPRIAAIAWGPGRAGVAVARVDGAVLIVDPDGRSPRTELVAPAPGAWAVRWSSSGEHLLLERDRGGVVILDPESGRVRGRLPERAGRVVDARDDRVTTAQADVDTTTLRTWRLDADQRRVLQHDDGVASLCVSPDGAHVGVAVGDGTLWLWAVAEPAAPPRRWSWQEGVVKGCAFSPDGALLAGWGIQEPGARLFRVADGAPAGQLPASGPLRRGAFLAADRFLPVTYAPVAGAPLDLAGRPVAPPLDRGGLVVDLVATSRGEPAVFVDDFGGVGRLDQGGARLTELLRVDAAGPLALSDDARWLAVGSGRGAKVRALDGALAVDVPAPAAPTALALSPDGRWLAAGSLDGALHFWSLPDGALRAEVRAHEARVGAVRFSPDGADLWSAGWDGRVLRWPVEGLGRTPEGWAAAVAARWGAAP